MSAIIKKKLIVPDGGWGWAIATAFSIYFFLVFSILAAFGLIYKNEFKNLGFSGTQSSFILSANGGISMLCGLINGYLLNKCGTRKISICSAILFMGGLIFTAYSTTFIQFFVSYGIITSIGIGMGLSSYSLAINQYFKKKRDKVTGYATAIYGTGTILFPQLVSYLLDNYSIKETMLIIAAIAGNTFVGAMLLQPVTWHMKVEEVTYYGTSKKEEANEEDTLFEQQSKGTGNSNGVCNDIATIHTSMTSLNVHKEINDKYQLNSPQSEEVTILRRILNAIIKIFDLSLLSNLVFLVILIGLSIDFFVEFNFLWIIPFVLIEGNLSVEQTATFMSVYAIADIFCRFFAPFISALLKRSNRIMYMIALLFVVGARFFLIFSTNYIPLLFVATAIGGFRGMRLVYWSLVIPEYIPTERLAAAFGLLFTFNGLWLLIGGPLLGVLRDISGNYKLCILILNIISLTTIGMWTIQMIYSKMKQRRDEDLEYM